MKLKFCGLTNLPDALAALELGADYLGFIINVPTSSRSISLDQFREIARQLPPSSVVAVVKSPAPELINALRSADYIGTIQLHDPEHALEPLPGKQVWAAVGIEIDTTSDQLEQFANTDMLILDDPKRQLIPEEKHVIEVTKQELVAELRPKLKGLGIAGGINPYNIKHVLDTYQPDLIDLASGVESAPGKKDPALMELIFANLNANEVVY